MQLQVLAKLYSQGYHFLLISKICAFFKGNVLKNVNVLISKKRAYFRVPCLFLNF